MPIEYDSSGIKIQNLNEILEERENTLKPTFGDEFVIDQTSPVGNISLANADNELKIQELIGWLLPNQIDAKYAEGVFLDAICEKNRIYRIQPQYTKINLTINGTPNTSFVKGDIVISDELFDIYYDLNQDCVIGSDGTVVATFICETYGPYFPLETSRFKIQTPIFGLTSVTMDYDNLNLILGRKTETDEELRRRREYCVGLNSIYTLEAIAANIYYLEGVNDVVYFENDTETTDANGLPMKSFEFVVDGGDEKQIVEKIFLNKPVGVRAYGETLLNVEDSEGVSRQIGFTKAENINIGIKITLSLKEIQADSWYQEVKTAIKEKFDLEQKIGKKVKDYTYYTVLTGFSEIDDIESIKFYEIGTTTEYSQYNITNKQIAKFDITNIEFIVE